VLRRSSWIAALAAVAAVIPAGSASAGIWTPVASNTTDTINAIEYQSDARAWFATTAGKIFTRTGGNFAQTGNFPGVTFNDVAFGPGLVGVAVGSLGTIKRSTDGGATWTALVTLPANVSQSCGSATPVATTGATFWGASWGNANTVYVVGQGPASGNTPLMFFSNDGGQTFSEVNAPGGACKTTPIVDPLTDVFALPGTPTYVTAIDQNFGAVFLSSNSWGGVAKQGDMINAFQSTPRMAVDPASPNRVWAVDHGTCGSLCFQYSEASGANEAPMTIGNVSDTSTINRVLYGVAYAGGSLVAAGASGEIYNSIDGKNAYLQRADGTLATNEWRSVGVSDAAHALVGGVGGSLVSTTSANTIPDIVAPAGTISGPATAQAGSPVAFTANVADNAGGSGIDPAGFTWTATGVPPATGNPVAVTFPSPGTYTLNVTFHDRAGNSGTASKVVTVSKAPTTQSVSSSASGATIKLTGPRQCVPAGGSFTTRLTWKKQKRKGNRFVKVGRADFFIDSKRVKIDRKAPFTERLTVKNLKAGSRHTLRARAFIKIKHGKPRSKSLVLAFAVCST
jgi:hypothetical protein